MAKQWQIWVTVFLWHDGDSAKCVADLGCRVFIGSEKSPVMLRSGLINAPELSTGAPGLAARDYAAQIAPPGLYAATSTGLDNYGRPLIDLHLPDGSLFSQRMLDSGHAVAYR